MDLQLSGLLINAIGILILSLFMGGIIYGFVNLIRIFIKTIKLKSPKILIYYFLMIICMILMAISWIMNIGWYRLLLTFIAFPIIHSVLFINVNGKALLKLSASPKLKKYTILSFATYLLSYLTFPDGGDIGPMRVFFGLVQSNVIAMIAFHLCLISFIAHIVVSSRQMHEIKRLNQIDASNP